MLKKKNTSQKFLRLQRWRIYVFIRLWLVYIPLIKWAYMITEVDLFSFYVNSHIRHYKTSAFVSLNFIRENNSKQQGKESRVRSCSFVHCLYKIDSFEKQVRKEKPYTWWKRKTSFGVFIYWSGTFYNIHGRDRRAFVWKSWSSLMQHSSKKILHKPFQCYL